MRLIHVLCSFLILAYCVCFPRLKKVLNSQRGAPVMSSALMMAHSREVAAVASSGSRPTSPLHMFPSKRYPFSGLLYSRNRLSLFAGVRPRMTSSHSTARPIAQTAAAPR